MPKKASQSEEEYFAKEDVEKRYQLHEKLKHDASESNEEHERQAHFMKCPKCGHDLETIRFGFVDIDQCKNCGAIVLDKGELERIVSEGRSLLKPLLDFFRQSNR